MTDASSPLLAPWRRWLWPERDLIVVTGTTRPVLRGREAYHREHAIVSSESDESRRLVERLVAGAGAAAVSLPVRESWGWTLTVPGSALGLFCGVEPDGRVCVRVREASPLRAAAVVQRQRAGGPLVQSHVESTSTDPARIVEHYFAQAEQTRARVAVDDGGDVVLVRPLPDARGADLLDRPDEALREAVHRARANDRLERLEDVLLYYGCRCNDAMVLEMIASLPDRQRREVWGDERELEIECPRCGRRYRIRREDWSAGPR
ncbi:MAG: hypothetical protein Kow0062_23230 [Acidobacteriota bacterium]